VFPSSLIFSTEGRGTTIASTVPVCSCRWLHFPELQQRCTSLLLFRYGGFILYRLLYWRCVEKQRFTNAEVFRTPNKKTHC
jgi:hypothetical protein